MFPIQEQNAKINEHKSGAFKRDSHRVVEGHGVDDHEVLQVVFVRRVVPVPSHHIERREILRAEHRGKQIRGVCSSNKTQKVSN